MYITNICTTPELGTYLHDGNDLIFDTIYFTTGLGSINNNDYIIRNFMQSLSDMKIHSLKLTLNTAPSDNSHIDYQSVNRRISHASSGISMFLKYALKFGIYLTLYFQELDCLIEFDPFKRTYDSKDIMSKRLKDVKIFNSNLVPLQGEYLFKSIYKVNFNTLYENTRNFVINNQQYYLTLYNNPPCNIECLFEEMINAIPSICAVITASFIITCIEYGILVVTCHAGEDNNYIPIHIYDDYLYRFDSPLQ